MREMRHRRHTLLGNAWSLHVAYFIAQALIIPHAQAGKAPGDSLQYAIAPQDFDFGRKNCPYIQQLDSGDSPLPRSIPPDWVEQHAYQAASLAEQVQARKHTSYHLDRTILSTGPIASLPKGLPPDVHYRAGCAATSPLDIMPDVPDDLDYAIRKTLELGAKASQWRRKRLKELKDWIKNASPVASYWEALHSDNAKSAAPKVPPHAIDLIAHSILWPDLQLPRMTATGAKPVGPQDSTEVFRHKSTQAEMSVAEFDAGSGQYMSKLMSRPPPKVSNSQRSGNFQRRR
jgi:hypothetical protein